MEKRIEKTNKECRANKLLGTRILTYHFFDLLGKFIIEIDFYDNFCINTSISTRSMPLAMVLLRKWSRARRARLASAGERIR